MKKNFKTIFAMLMACILCLAGSVNAFASNDLETKEVLSVEESQIESEIDTQNTRAAGNLLYADSASISSRRTITITTDEGNWDANFYVGVIGNTGDEYYVCMTDATGETCIATAVGDGGLVNIKNMTYAKKGTYTFYFECYGSPSGTGTAMVQIFD